MAARNSAPLNSDAMPGSRSWPAPSVRSSLTRRRHTSPRRSGNASRSGSSRSHTIGDTSARPCLSAHASRVASTSRVLRASVVVGQPDPVGAQRQGVQHAQRETACAAEVSARPEIGGRDGLAGHQVAHPLVVVVVDDDQVVGRAALGGQARPATWPVRRAADG